MSKGDVYILTNSSIRKGVAATMLALAALLTARGETETIDGYTWIYGIVGNGAKIGIDAEDFEVDRAVSPEPIGNLSIPSTLGKHPVTSIGWGAFSGCSGLTSVTMPSSVTSIGYQAFYGCTGLISFFVDEDNPNFKAENGLLLTKDGGKLVAGINGDVVIPSSVTSIGSYAFSGCSGLTSVTIPSSVTSIGKRAFCNCAGLTSVTLEGDAPMTGDAIFDGTSADLIVHVKGSSSGWTQWNGRVIRFDADGGTASSTVNMNLSITNVHVHYIQTSELSPMAAPITKDVGIVNVMTEIKCGNVSIPESWVTNYPTFKATFGEDFASALVKTTGKVDAGGSPLYVWQDYVAGTDPTDENDVFRASVTMVEGKPVISYTPELSEVEKAKRKYITWGKVKLHDEKWVEVPKGNEDDYNFFKVTVEMR